MEENKKTGLLIFGSLMDALDERSPSRGQKTLYLNAAMAMMLLADEEERERWVGVVERARRMQDNRSILERVRELVGKPPAPPAATPGPNPPKTLTLPPEPGLPFMGKLSNRTTRRVQRRGRVA